MSNELTLTTGKSLSFYQLFSEKDWKVEIPIIQRDYAQGRKTTKEIRENFINTLFEYIHNGLKIDLDFVYGNLNDSDKTIFIPLDGQQRLTTLFLLHWYLAINDKCFEDFTNVFILNHKSKFSYKTRTSSTEFFDALVSHPVNLNNLLQSDVNKSNSISKTIKDLAFFFSSWIYDPTIQSALTMLDSIHSKFYGSVGYYKKITNTKNPLITFQFLNIDKLKLTDDLYIKMNSRGKQLTPFENFKAKFEHDIKQKVSGKDKKNYELNYNNIDKKVSAHEYFAHKIDTDWANLFWNYRNIANNLFDEQLMNFIRVIITNHYAIKEKSEDKIGNLRILIGKDTPESSAQKDSPISYYQYKELECFDSELIVDLISIFDLLTNENEGIKQYLTDSFYFDETKVFIEAISNNIGYRNRLRFYAFYKYLLQSNGSDGLNDWMRVIYNLTENYIYNRPEEFSRSIESIKSLLSYSKNIHSYLTNTKNEISGFPEIQVFEERIKAELILKDDNWKKSIIEIEQHGYFTGQIGFIINFSGIEEYYIKNRNCAWDSSENRIFYKSFSKYVEKAKSIFDNNGLKKFQDFVWERALLSKGDYLLQLGSNYSFLIDTHRDISWKRLLRDSNDGRRNNVKELFDTADFNENDAEQSLKNICKNSSVLDWRKHFVEIHENIAYLGFNKFIRWIEDDEIYLLKKERMSGTHAEYYSYSFYIKYLKDKQKDFVPFNNTWYCEVSGDEDYPCTVLDGFNLGKKEYEIDIYFDDEKDFLPFPYQINFLEINDKPIDKEIIDILIGLNFTDKKYENEPVGYYCSVSLEDDVIKLLKSLCTSLNKIKI